LGIQTRLPPCRGLAARRCRSRVQNQTDRLGRKGFLSGARGYSCRLPMEVRVAAPKVDLVAEGQGANVAVRWVGALPIICDIEHAASVGNG
jgi:hypothetical protein